MSNDVQRLKDALVEIERIAAESIQDHKVGVSLDALVSLRRIRRHANDALRAHEARS